VSNRLLFAEIDSAAAFTGRCFLHDHRPVQVTDFQGDQFFNFDYSRDGKWLAVARGRVTDDVVLISELK